MKLTNKYGLPTALVEAVRNDSYDRGDSDFTATELIGPARIRALKKIHEEALEEDVSDRLWSLYGQVAHFILERANKVDLAEKRFYMTILDKKVSAQIDTLSLDENVLTDYKMTTVWKFMAHKPPPDDWVWQLNIQALLLKENGHNVESLQVVGLLRDWSEAQKKRNKNYPNTNLAKMHIPSLDPSIVKEYIRLRIHAHLMAQITLPLCTKEETWDGRRCKRYCQVSKWCAQFHETSNVL